MNEIVRQHNDFIDLPLRKFTASEMDILLAICYKCQDKETEEVILPFEQIRKLSDYRAKDDERFFKDIESMGDKLFSLKIKIGSEREYTKFILFPTYTVSEETQTLTVGVHPKFAYLLNELTGNYTSLELKQSASLISSYSKAIYKKLRKFKTTGVWQVHIEDFRSYLDVPIGYTISKIDARIINPAIDELSKFFLGLKCEKQFKKTKGRGRPSVCGYKFTFKAESKKEKKVPSQDAIARLTKGWEKTARYCPQCKRIMFSKYMENDSGGYTMYGHTDWKTGECNYITNDYADLLEAYQVEPEDRKRVFTEEEKLLNKKKLAELLSRNKKE